MIVKKTHPWGKISKKLKIAPENALKLFGFKMRENEKYIIFKIRNGKQLITHYSTPHYPCFTDRMKQIREKFGVLSKIYKHMGEIKTGWEEEAKGTKFNGMDLFLMANKRVMKENSWKNLIITKGKLEKPCASYAYYRIAGNRVFLKVIKEKNKGYELHIVLIDIKKMKIKEVIPKRRGKLVISSYGMNKPIVCMYFKRKKEVSNSVTFILKKK